MSRSPSSEKRPGWYWSEYWRSGRGDVMTIDGASGSAPFDAAPLWSAFFQTFEDGARLLDLATGGGQVARIAAAAGREAGKRFEVTGVDYADLGPLEGASPEGYTLTGGVALEKLPLPAAHFDGASSQFGIEYAEPRAALAELSRVLKPGGRAMLLLHHKDSAISHWIGRQAAAFQNVAGDGLGARQARRAFTAHLKQLPPAALREAETVFRDAVARMQARLEPDPAFEPAEMFVRYLDDLAQRIGRYEPASALRRLEEAEAANAAWSQRHRSQLRAALDAGGLDAFLQRAERSGLTLADRSETRDGEALIAWRVELAKA